MRGPEPYFDAVKWLRTAAATAVLRRGDLGIGTRVVVSKIGACL